MTRAPITCVLLALAVLPVACEDTQEPAAGGGDGVSAPGVCASCPDGVFDTSNADGTVPIGAGDSVSAPPGLRRIEVEIAKKDWEELNEQDDDKEEVEAEVVLRVDGQELPGTEMEQHGGYARTVPKKSFRFVIRDELDAWLDLFGDGPEKQRRFVIKASWNDRSYLRGWLTMDLLRAMGAFAPRISFAELYVNGGYEGLYLVVERIDKPYLGRQGLNKHANVYKAENHSANWKAKGNALSGYDHEIGEDEGIEDLEELLDVLTFTPTSEAKFKDVVEPRLSIDDFLTWQCVHTLAMNHDTYTKNYYLHHDLDAVLGQDAYRFRIISWDADATWGNDWDGEELPPTEDAWHGKDAFSPRLFVIDAYREQYVADYLSALDGVASEAALLERVDAIAPKIRSAALLDLKKWQPDISFDAELTRLREAIKTRRATMKAALPKAL